jgi:hypothetical protein
MTKEQIDSLQELLDAEMAKLDGCNIHEITRESIEITKKQQELDLLKEANETRSRS